MSNWTQPQCEKCWIKEHFDLDGPLLVGRFPHLVYSQELRRCCTCGEPTIVGIFIRIDPQTVPYPEPEETRDD